MRDLPKILDVCLDIETAPSIPAELHAALVADVKPKANLKDPAKIAADVAQKQADVIGKAGLDPLTAGVVSVALRFVHFDDQGTEAFSHEWVKCAADFPDGEGTVEERLLLALRERLDAARRSTDALRLVTYNGRRFDVPFIAARCAVNDLHGWGFFHLGRSSAHYDLLDLFPGGLAKWGILLGFPKLAEGSDVAMMVESGSWDDLKAYNLGDVRLLSELWRRASRAAAW